MKKYKIFITCIVSLLISFSTFAATAMPIVNNQVMVHDLHGYLSEADKVELEEKAQQLSSEYSMPVVIVITGDSMGYSSSKAFIDAFYEGNNFSSSSTNDGIAFLVDMDSRVLDVRVYGSMDDIFSERDVNNIADVAAETMIVEDSIYLASDEFLNLSEQVLVRGSDRTAPTYSASDSSASDSSASDSSGSGSSSSSSSGSSSGSSPFVYVAGSFGISGIILAILYFMHSRTLPSQTSAMYYVNANNMHLTQNTDQFVRTYTTKTRIQNSNSSGGSSGGSSGRSSGGSRSFGSSGGGSSRGASRGF